MVIISAILSVSISFGVFYLLTSFWGAFYLFSSVSEYFISFHLLSGFLSVSGYFHRKLRTRVTYALSSCEKVLQKQRRCDPSATWHPNTVVSWMKQQLTQLYNHEICHLLFHGCSTHLHSLFPYFHPQKILHRRIHTIHRSASLQIMAKSSGWRLPPEMWWLSPPPPPSSPLLSGKCWTSVDSIHSQWCPGL